MSKLKLSKKQLQSYLEKWNKKNGPKEKLWVGWLKDLFEKKYPNNKDINQVLIKCAALDKLYSTNVKYLFDVAKKIVSIQNFDEKIKKGEQKIVKEMMKVNNINYYSFATKYCYYSDSKKRYPIYDSYIDKVLKHLRDNNEIDYFENNQLKIYSNFVEILEKIKKNLNCSFEELDHYLWQLGKENFPKKTK